MDAGARSRKGACEAGRPRACSERKDALFPSFQPDMARLNETESGTTAVEEEVAFEEDWRCGRRR